VQHCLVGSEMCIRDRYRSELDAVAAERGE
jgi:hypothetical protein